MTLWISESLWLVKTSTKVSRNWALELYSQDKVILANAG